MYVIIEVWITRTSSNIYSGYCNYWYVVNSYVCVCVRARVSVPMFILVVKFVHKEFKMRTTFYAQLWFGDIKKTMICWTMRNYWSWPPDVVLFSCVYIPCECSCHCHGIVCLPLHWMSLLLLYHQQYSHPPHSHMQPLSSYHCHHPSLYQHLLHLALASVHPSHWYNPCLQCVPQLLQYLSHLFHPHPHPHPSQHCRHFLLPLCSHHHTLLPSKCPHIRANPVQKHLTISPSIDHFHSHHPPRSHNLTSVV